MSLTEVTICMGKIFLRVPREIFFVVERVPPQVDYVRIVLFRANTLLDGFLHVKFFLACLLLVDESCMQRIVHKRGNEVLRLTVGDE